MATVAVLTAGDMLHFELAVAYEILGNRPSGARDWYEVQLCGPAPIQVGPFTVAPG